jgi:glucokinase
MLIAGDIGGTKTLLALFTQQAGIRQPIAQTEYHSADYPSLEPMVRAFLAANGQTATEACFDVAGPVIDGHAHLTNLSWNLDEAAMGASLGLRRLTLMNDLKAVAYAVPHLGAGELHTLNPGKPAPGAPIAVIAPGTGLGEAFLIPSGNANIACASEGGHASFSPADARQDDLCRYLARKFGHVSMERVCSGLGIANIFDFLRDASPDAESASFLESVAAAHDPTPLISQAAEQDPASHPLCVAALDLFVDILGNEAGNLALKVLATGGVYLGGGIPPRMLARLDNGAFLKAFTAKGRMAGMLAAIPVHVITAQAALMGAAQYGLDRMSEA